MNVRFLPALALASLVGGCATFQVVRGPDACDQQKTFEDPFEGTTQGNIFYFNFSWQAVGLVAKPSQVTFKALWLSRGVVDASIGKGALIDLALTDGSFMALEIVQEAPPVKSAGSYGVATQWETIGHVDQQSLKRLSEVGITSMRLRDIELVPQIAVPLGVTNRFQTLAICLNDTIGEMVAPSTPAEAEATTRL